MRKVLRCIMTRLRSQAGFYYHNDEADWGNRRKGRRQKEEGGRQKEEGGKEEGEVVKGMG